MISLKTILKCTVPAEENRDAERSKSLPRSRSLLAKLGRMDDDEVCIWNYGFVLETVDRSMELFAPTRKDRDKWIHVLNLIVDMNHNNFGTSSMSPFVYEK